MLDAWCMMFDASSLDTLTSINQSVGFVKRPLQNWTVVLDRSAV